MTLEETKRALIVVKTYPTPAQKGAEVSCTAAITEDGKWLRLFPVPWRYLEREQQFKKYQWVDLSVTKASDPRPESYKLKQNGITIRDSVGTSNEWKARKEIIFPLRSHCLCCMGRLLKRQKHPTLGIFRPKKIEKLIISADSPNWSSRQLAILRQGHLFGSEPKQQLEKIPFKFQYQFRCECSSCEGHKIICTDWEIAESYRRWKADYGDKWEEAFRQKYEHEMIEKKDTHFYMGTVHQHPHTWIIVGLFYPPRSPAKTLSLYEQAPLPVQ